MSFLPAFCLHISDCGLQFTFFRTFLINNLICQLPEINWLWRLFFPTNMYIIWRIKCWGHLRTDSQREIFPMTRLSRTSQNFFNADKLVSRRYVVHIDAINVFYIYRKRERERETLGFVLHSM